MNLNIKLFAAARQITGSETVEVTIDSGATIADLKQALVDRYPDLSRLVQHAMFAVDTEYAAVDHILAAGAEVAMIPPVSGG